MAKHTHWRRPDRLRSTGELNAHIWFNPADRQSRSARDAIRARQPVPAFADMLKELYAEPEMSALQSNRLLDLLRRPR